jgi:CHAT domain-containing protein
MVVLAALLPLLLAPVPAGSEGAGAPMLAAGATVQRTLTGGNHDDFTLALRRGESVSVVVEQRGIDLSEELLDPAGRRLVRVDTPRGAWGPERLWAVAETSGPYLLRIRPLDDQAGGGYTLTVVAVRAATREDRDRAAAEGLHMRSRDWEERATEAGRQASRTGLARALARWESLGDPEQEALVWEDHARIRMASGDSRGAIEASDRALSRAEAAGDRQLEAKILATRGLALQYLGDPQAALVALDRSLMLARAVGDPQQEASALHLEGWSHWNLGNYQEALDRDQRSLAIGRSIHDREAVAWALNGIGLTWWAFGDPEKSLGPFEESIALWRQLGDPRDEVFALANLGFSYWTLGATRRALAAFRQVLPVTRRLGDRTAEALALNNIGLAQISLEEYADAAATLNDALTLWKATGNVHGLAITLRNLGAADEGLGRFGESEARWNEALSAARRSSDRRNEAACLAAVARLEARRGALDEARARVEESLSVVESLRGDIAVPGLKSSFLSSQQDVYAIAVDIYLILDAREPGHGWAARAFQASERARARALLEGIAEAKLDLAQDLPEDLHRREAELSARIKDLQARSATASRSEKPDLEHRLELAEDEWDQLIAEMRRRTPRYASLRYPQAASAEEARRGLAASTAIVAYSTSPERIVVFVLTATAVTARRLDAPPAAVADRVEDFVGLISRDDADRWRRLAGRLHADLVAPWIGTLAPSVRSLVVVPDGPLASLPFETLMPEGPGGRRLVETFDISYAPSATALAELRIPRSPSTGVADLLVVADPPVGTARGGTGRASAEEAAFDLAALPQASAEARSVARFGGPGTELLTGPRASERRLREMRLERFGVLHFATHGLLDVRHPTRSGLLLAGENGADGLLTAREIHRLRLQSDLVVLSACQTARGRVLAGEGVQSLARAFFHAGARSVVATLWNVNDRWSERLMTAFYDRMARGDSRAEALTNAKRALLAAEPHLAPRSWAAFVLIGDGQTGVALARPWWLALFRP